MPDTIDCALMLRRSDRNTNLQQWRQLTALHVFIRPQLKNMTLTPCWKNLAERMEEEVLDKYKVKDSEREACKGRGRPAGVEAWAQKQEIQNKKVVRRLLGKYLRLVLRVQLAASAKQAGGVNGRRRDEAAAKNGDYERSCKENQIKRKHGR